MALTEREVEAFCGHCDWCFGSWLFAKSLFEDNPDNEVLKGPVHEHFFHRLWWIAHEYWIGEVAKLDDPAKQRGNYNLSLDYIIQNGDWTEDVQSRLEGLKVALSSFARHLIPARNKITSHIDRNTALDQSTLGAFPKGEDSKYFESLQEFVNIVHQNYLDGTYPFDDLVRNDVEFFKEAFRRGVCEEN